MASKQLGKLRQWAGEVISARDKSTVTDEFRELETDVELRKEGLLRLQFATEAYHHALSKKKDYTALDQSKEKLLPVDTLGLVMRNHGEDFGEDSAFGTSLVKFGEAHSKVATLQEAYALTLQDTFLASIKKFGEDIKDYEHQRKKLESRRLSYDAAISKVDKVKSSKKEKAKDRKEAEDELQMARLRYEETSEDVRARARAIQQNEIQQLRDLTDFLDVEMNFVQQYLEVLQDVKSNWCDTSSLSPVDIPRGNGPTHTFSRAADDAKSDSGHSKRSTKSSRSNVVESESSGDESTGTANRRSATHRRSGSRLSSRPASRASRKRAESGATASGAEKDKEKSDTTGRMMSVAGWASSAVSSVTGLGKKDKENFASLTDDEDGSRDGDGFKRRSSSTSFTHKHSRSKSKENTAGASPKIPTRIIRPPSLQEKKVVRALHDFAGSTDELTFKAGDEIVVLNEVLDGWWMGELDGQKGLFPTLYTEVLSSPSKDYVRRPNRMGTSLSSTDDSSGRSPLDEDGYVTSDVDDNDLFSDPPATLVATGRSPLYGNFDAESVTDSVAEDEEEKRLMPARQTSEDDDYDHHTRSRSISQQALPSIISRRIIPPPPPPRRPAANTLAPPPVPQRNLSSLQSRSSGSLHSASQSSSVSSLGHEVSPFESATEIPITGCQNFRQNPFKPSGMCSNCLQVHV